MTPLTASLPLIDISPFLTPSPDPAALQHCTLALSDACLHHGFFYLTNHGIDAKLTDTVLSLARDFFTKCTDAEKQPIKRQDAGKGFGDGARGYQVIGDNVTQGKWDWHEAVDWYRPVIAGEGITGQHLNNTPSQQSNGTNKQDNHGEGHRTPPYTLIRGVNLWPAHPPAFRAIYEAYIEKMLHLGTAVVRAMGHALALEDPETFVKATRESFWVMRAIGYPSVREADALSCGPHTDYGCLTLLLADGTEGALQVRSGTSDNHEEGSWINAEPIPGALVVNIGDMMERWTNGLWKSTAHRVVHKGEGFRVSVPFFFEPDFKARVTPLGECVRVTGGVERYGEVGYGEHLVGKVGGNFYGSGDE
jgi:isopenicillin N synthase-like dioxygenase